MDAKGIGCEDEDWIRLGSRERQVTGFCEHG